MLFQILSADTRKDILGEAIDAETLAIKLPELINQVGEIIVTQHENDFDDWVKTSRGILYFEVCEISKDLDIYIAKIYTDINFMHELDHFSIYPEDCNVKDKDSLCEFAREYIKKNY